MVEQLRLVKPDAQYRQPYLAMVEEFHSVGEDRALRHQLELLTRDFETYVQRLQEMARGIGLKPGWVPQTTFWSVEPGLPLIIGTLQLRHWLTPALEKRGGHIGYAITPSRRGQGYGTRQLALGLKEARALGLTRVLITCDTDNIASTRVIQKNGGVFEDELLSEETGKLTSRYWIDLTTE